MQAIQIEYPTMNDTRVLIFEINEETGYASVIDIIEAENHNIAALVQYLQEGYPGINAVKVNANQEGAQPVGRCWVVIPDALGVFELAETLAQKRSETGLN